MSFALLYLDDHLNLTSRIWSGNAHKEEFFSLFFFLFFFFFVKNDKFRKTESTEFAGQFPSIKLRKMAKME